MDFKEFKTGHDDNDRRLDKVIRLFAPDFSLAEIYKAIRKGLIKVNQKKTKAEYRIQENDIIFIASFLLNKNDDKNKDNDKKNNLTAPHKKTCTDISSLKMPEIIFENKDILIINKPYNVNVHGDNNSLDKIVEAYYNSKKLKNSLSFKPGPIHRLDKKTTGLLAFSMSLEGARWFAENIKNHKIQKKYYGLTEGYIPKKEEWRDFISKNDSSNDSQNDSSNVSSNDSSNGSPNNSSQKFHTVSAKKQSSDENNEKIAETIVTPIDYGTYKGKTFTLAEFHIKTGRKHQIRAQSALHNHPLAGDTAYGGKKLNIGKQDFYLTARELIIPKENPLGLPENLKVKLPNDFINILKSCEIKKTGV